MKKEQLQRFSCDIRKEKDAKPSAECSKIKMSPTPHQLNRKRTNGNEDQNNKKDAADDHLEKRKMESRKKDEKKDES